MICRNEGIGYIVSYTSSSSDIVEEWTCDAVAVCTRLHVVPNIPHTKGTQSIPKVLHSSEFKERSQFGVGKDVVILGSGGAGMDLAYLAVTSPTTVSPSLCVIVMDFFVQQR